MKIHYLIAIACVFLGCSSGGSKSTDNPDPPGAGGERPALLAQECASRGGQVVGDIGDGAIFRPDYVCPSGKPPLGTIKPDPEGPVAVEGAVCCPVE